MLFACISLAAYLAAAPFGSHIYSNTSKIESHPPGLRVAILLSRGLF